MEYGVNKTIDEIEHLKKDPFKKVYVDSLVEHIVSLSTDFLNGDGAASNFAILAEECAELSQAILKILRDDGRLFSRDNTIEEMAHVYASMCIVANLLNITPADIQMEINKKLKKHGLIY